MLKQIKNFLIMTLSITIMAIGVYYFKFPNNFTFGGVTGAAVVLPEGSTPLSASYVLLLLLNIASACSGLFLPLAKALLLRPPMPQYFLSVELLVLEKLRPAPLHPLSNEPMLELIFAIALRMQYLHLHCFSYVGCFKWRNRCHRHDCRKICTCRKYRHGFISHRPRHDYHRLLCI